MSVIAVAERDRKVTLICGRHTVMLTLTELAKVLCGSYPKPTLGQVKAKRDEIPQDRYEFYTPSQCPMCFGQVYLLADDEANRTSFKRIVAECTQRDGETSIDPKRKARLRLAKDFLKYGNRGLLIDTFLPPLLEGLMLAGIDYDEATEYLNQQWMEFSILAEF